MSTGLIKDIKKQSSDIIDFVQCFFDFWPHKYQVEFLTKCVYERRVAALWCRQTGKSTCIAYFCLYKILTERDFNIIIISPTQRQSSELYVKIRDELTRSEFFEEYVEISTKTEVKLKNGSRIVSLPSGPEGASIRGFTGDIVILEECGIMKDKIVNEVVMPMIASKDEGQVIKIGTPKGKNNFWQSCYGKETKYWLSHIDYKKALKYKQIREEFITEQKNNLTDLEFRTEYEAQFIEDSDAYFKQELIESCIEDIKMWEEGSDFNINHKFCQYYCGVDIARMGEDKSVITVIEKRGEQMKLVYCKELEHKKTTVVSGFVKRLHRFFNFQKICLDETGVGAGPTDTLSDELNKEDFANIVEGVIFTVKSKEDMYSNLKKVMEQGKLKFGMIRKMYYEISDLRYELTNSGNVKIHHSEGGHDDYPDSLMLAVWAAREDAYDLSGRHIY